MRIHLGCIGPATLLLFPALANTHSIGFASNEWQAGFDHPLHSFDHLLAIISIGIWAAQQQGRAIWLTPLTFVGAMSLGGIAGATGINFPYIDLLVTISVAVLSVLIVRRTRLWSPTGILVVSFFAFFNGLAHGVEMPTSASLASFGLGFSAATLLLHGFGIAAGRILCMFSWLLGSAAEAQQISNEPAATSALNTRMKEAGHLEEVIVLSRAESLIGIADSASEGNIGEEQLKSRPIIRPGEILETVPGLIVSQHSGEGKANQYYLRGYNLDHGTDFLTQLDGVPLNLVTHAHGQGWTDTGFLIPELVRTVHYKKGVYYAENGDFSSAGAADIQYSNTLPSRILKFEGGNFNYYRSLLASSFDLNDNHFLYALEGTYNDGPWQHGDHYKKQNGVLRYNHESDDSGWTATFMGYQARWRATDQIPKRAVEGGQADRFGALDTTDGGNSSRYSVTVEWHRHTAQTATNITAYGYYNTLDLFSNFTYFLNDPTRGDQFEQPDRRWVSGLQVSHRIDQTLGDARSESTFGLQIRNDDIRNGLYLTEARQRFAAVREDTVRQTAGSAYFQNKTTWSEWLRTILGLRVDEMRFDVNSNRIKNSGQRTAGLFSPKINLVFGPWGKTEVYLSGGTGFHSNDARGVNTYVDPISQTNVDSNGDPVKPAKPLVRTRGSEIGIRTMRISNLQSTIVLWLLDSESELVFSGDAGTTSPSRASRRYGVEFTNYYSPTKWLSLDADISASHAYFREEAPEGNHIPGSIETVIAAGATIKKLSSMSGSIRLRYFGPRSLIEDNSVRSRATVLLTAFVGYDINEDWTVHAEVFNFLNRKDSAIEYYYTSRLPNEELDGQDDIHFHPVEPLSIRVGVTAKF